MGVRLQRGRQFAFAAVLVLQKTRFCVPAKGKRIEDRNSENETDLIALNRGIFASRKFATHIYRQSVCKGDMLFILFLIVREFTPLSVKWDTATNAYNITIRFLYLLLKRNISIL